MNKSMLCGSIAENIEKFHWNALITLFLRIDVGSWHI